MEKEKKINGCNKYIRKTERAINNDIFLIRWTVIVISWILFSLNTS